MKTRYNDLDSIVLTPSSNQRPKLFRRLSLTVDEETMSWLGLDPATVTAAELRERLKTLTQGDQQCPTTV